MERGEGRGSFPFSKVGAYEQGPFMSVLHHFRMSLITLSQVVLVVPDLLPSSASMLLVVVWLVVQGTVNNA